MSRKTMSKEVTKTTVQVAKMVKGDNGLPQVEMLPEVVLIGNVSLEKAQKEVNKKYDFIVTVFGVEASTEVYEMAVEDFLKHATLKVEQIEIAEEADPVTA